MTKLIDLVGQQFGRLTVVEIGPSEKGIRYWSCRCICGTELEVRAGNLRSGNTTSCGCKSDEHRRSGLATRRHGYTDSPTWNSWKSMLERCSSPRFKHYYGKGISVCDSWKVFENFLADMGERPPGTTLDRIDSTGNYAPGNCRWADHVTQLNNRSINRRLTFSGRTMTTAEWAREVGVSRHALFQRLKAGWSVERALTTPMKPDRRRKAQPA